MNFEILTSRDFDLNFGDFRKCENNWTEIDKEVVDLLLHAQFKNNYNEMKGLLLKGKALPGTIGFIRLKTNLEKCPLCGSNIEENMHSLSIVDNKTKICPDCGTREQLESFIGNYDR